MSTLHEECGVFGIYSPVEGPVAYQVNAGLCALQHRGQEGCGIVVNKGGLFTSHKGIGLLSEVFDDKVLDKLGEGSIAVGHVRYGTTGANQVANVQPMVVNHHKGHMALAHNGNLTNAGPLREALELEGSIFQSTSDTEVICHIITKERLKVHSIEDACANAMDKLEGAYSLVIVSPSKLVALRDKNGFRPLCYGVLPNGGYVVSSETCGLDVVGAKFVREIEPGEIMIFDKNGCRNVTTHCNKRPRSFCVFEAVYFARPDSVMDGHTVHSGRLRAGALLAQEHPADADIVIGVPDSGLDAAVGYARESSIPYEIGFIKNKYIARTFIAPGQANREQKVRLKLNPVVDAVRGKRVVLIDDSIVRGTTSKYIVAMLREAGAAEIHMRISAPPFLNPCYYGTDIDSRDNLIACQRSVEEIADYIGADSLGYLSVEGVKTLLGNQPHLGYCTACFDGNYAVEPPAEGSKNRFESSIAI